MTDLCNSKSDYVFSACYKHSFDFFTVSTLYFFFFFFVFFFFFFCFVFLFFLGGEGGEKHNV